jgi:hypothetical protein
LLALALAGAALLLGGCAGSVKSLRAPAADATPIAGVARVETRMSPDATRQQADNPQFNREELAGYLRRRLEGKRLIGSAATHRVEIVITDLRVRSAVAAVLFGAFAGDDHVHGRVRVLDGAGRVVQSFDVQASYALGGWAGGQDGVRLNWLYDKFSDLAAGELEKVVGQALPGTAAVAAVERPARRVDDVDAVPGNERTRDSYRDFLTKRLPRAFVVADGNRSNYTWGANPKDPTDPKDPLERALKHCRDQGKQHCRAYAVDQRVVYGDE